jgi:ribose transport system permease protein
MSAVTEPVPRQAIALASIRDYGIVGAFTLIFVVLSLSSDVFLSADNLLNILDQMSAVGIMACAWTLVVIAGGFDLSVGAIYAFAGVVAAKLAMSVDPAMGLLVAPLVGLAIGTVNGLLATVGRINSFMATLASSFIIRGVALVVSGGFLIRVAAEDGSRTSFDVIGRGELFGAKYSVYLFVLVALLCGFILHRTILGRFIYAVGGNAEAARLSGVRVNLVRGATFALSGMAAGIAGMIVASRVSTGQPDIGVGIEFDVIAAVVIGGTSILGGAGAIWRTVVGVLMLAMIGNGFNLLNVDTVYQRVILGAIILVSVALDAWSRRKST